MTGVCKTRPASRNGRRKLRRAASALRTHSPAEDAEDEVEHEEGADHNEGDEVDDVESVAHGVVELQGIEEKGQS